MASPRVVSAEVLDRLAERDPAAVRARADLRRVHRAMGTRGIIVRALRRWPSLRRRDVTPGGRVAPLRVLELGAGDGTLMLGVARALRAEWPAVELTLLDRQDVVERSTIAAYAALGWTAEPKVVDVLDWSAPDRGTIVSSRWDVVVATLFLHHFEGAALAQIVAAVAARSHYFFACEPRRAPLAFAGSHLIGALGVGPVTREDAVLSVRAGFRGSELGALWPEQGWRLREYPAGLFSHCLLAERVETH